MLNIEVGIRREMCLEIEGIRMLDFCEKTIASLINFLREVDYI